jgi:O-antigen/teichoic acid export membrane protein
MYEKVKKSIQQNEFLKNILLLSGGNSLALFVPFIFAPLLSRLYTPGQFGELQLFISIYGLLSIFGTLNYENALMLPKKESHAALLLKSLLMMSFIFCLILYGLTFTPIKKWMHQTFDIAIILIYLIPVAIIIQAWGKSMELWHNRNKNFKTSSTSNVLNSSGASVGQAASGVLNYNFGLIWGHLLGKIIRLIWLQFKHFQGKKVKRNLYYSLSQSKNVLKKYSNFPRFSMLSELINQLSVQIPIFLLGYYFSTTVVGHYTLPFKYLNAPLFVFRNSISSVFYQKASDLYNKGTDYRPLLFHLIKTNLKIFAVPFLVIAVYGDILFMWFFGKEWQEAGYFAMMMAPWLLMVITVSPTSIVFNILHKQRLGLILNIALLTFRGLSIMTGILFFNSYYVAVGGYCIAGFVYWLVMIFFIQKITQTTNYRIFIYILGIILFIAMFLYIIRLLIF